MYIQRLAWAGLKIEVGSTTVFIDAIERASSYIDNTELEKQVRPLQSDKRNRHALITHTHRDHFDPEALQNVLGNNGSVVCHQLSVGSAVAPNLHVRGVDLYEPIFFDTFTADIMAIAVPATDGFGEYQVSWIIDGNGRRVIHCGDTIWHGHWWNIARQFGPFDVAFVPINGVTYNRHRFTGSNISASMTPEQAVIAAHILNAKAVCPIHYGLFHDPVHYAEFPDAETTFLKATNQYDLKPLLLSSGEILDWSGIV